MNKPIRREKPELDLSWGDVIGIIIIGGLIELALLGGM